LVGQAQKLADDAIANINKATTNDAVNTAKENGVETINNMNVPTTSATKDDAKDAIDQAAKTKDDAIDASNLTAEEKDALKKTVADRKSTRLNSSHVSISYAVFCLKKKKNIKHLL